MVGVGYACGTRPRFDQGEGLAPHLPKRLVDDLPRPVRICRANSRATVEMRGFLMAGNWKMNTLLPEAVSLAKEVGEASKTAADNVDVAVCAPFPFLAPVKDALAGTKVGLGAQDCYTAEAGAFTGATSTAMLESVGCDYVLSGHSERRAIFGDTDEDINAKVRPHACTPVDGTQVLIECAPRPCSAD